MYTALFFLSKHHCFKVCKTGLFSKNWFSADAQYNSKTNYILEQEMSTAFES